MARTTWAKVPTAIIFRILLFRVQIRVPSKLKLTNAGWPKNPCGLSSRCEDLSIRSLVPNELHFRRTCRTTTVHSTTTRIIAIVCADTLGTLGFGDLGSMPMQRLLRSTQRALLQLGILVFTGSGFDFQGVSCMCLRALGVEGSALGGCRSQSKCRLRTRS